MLHYIAKNSKISAKMFYDSANQKILVIMKWYVNSLWPGDAYVSKDLDHPWFSLR